MKTKLILSFILILCFSFQCLSKSTKVTPYNPDEKVYWDFLKERLFDGENSFVSSFQGDIVINLNGAGKQDSSIVINLMSELRGIIPNRDVRLTKEVYEVDENGKLIHSICVGFVNDKAIDSYTYEQRAKNINGNDISWDGFKGIYQNDIFTQAVNIHLNDSASFELRKCYIEYGIVKSLCTIKGKKREVRTFVEGAILNRFDYNPVHTEFSDVDKFVIEKLYSDDFKKQFKNYMLANGTWRRYLVFTHNNTMKPIMFFTCIVIGLLIFIFAYKPVLKRNYRNKYLGYLIPALLVINTWIITYSIYTYYTTNDVIVHRLNLLPYALFNLFAVLLAFALYFIERIDFISKLKSSRKLVVKVNLTFFIAVIPLSIALPFISGFEMMFMFQLWAMGLGLAAARGTFLYLKSIGELEIQEKELELIALKEANTRVEIQSLHARINPHFLYNSLNSIAGLAHSDAHKTENMALALSDMFRYSINRKKEVYAEVDDEVKMVRSYLEIEQIRFGDRMDFKINVDEEVKIMQIPKFIIQPLVENAIKHGISKIEGKGMVALEMHIINDSIEISVSDNGPDFPEGLIAGYGLQSLYDLLKICYGEKAKVAWQNSPIKKIEVLIPLNA